MPDGTVLGGVPGDMVASMSDPTPVRVLGRLKVIGVILPIAFVWLFEVARFYVGRDHQPAEEVHVVAALIMGAAVLVFGVVMAWLLDRTQRDILSQNRDMTTTRAVASAVHGGLGLGDTISDALERVLEQTGALAGIARLGDRPDDIVVRRPETLPGGLEWLNAILDEPVHGIRSPRFAQRRELDTLIMDLPFVDGGDWLGYMRLAFHPPVEVPVSPSVLAQIAADITTAVRVGRLVADLERRQRERAALYDVALQLTGRAQTKDVLDSITLHARTLLAAESAIVCLADMAQRPASDGRTTERLGLTDAGTVTMFRHQGNGVEHAPNPLCPLRAGVPGDLLLVRPLRGPDGPLGELCVARPGGPAFSAAERNLLGAFADMAAIAVRTARLGEAEQQWTILSERDRIARELHDSLAQVLGHLHLRLRGLEAALDGAAPLVATELNELATVADEAFRDVREAILGLRETISPETGLEGALREYLAKYRRQTGIAATLACDQRVRDLLSPEAEVQLLRVVQEALTNVRKHAGARRVVVRIRREAGRPVLEVEDDGSGFDPAAVRESLAGGFGMTSMRERVEQIGGNLEVESAIGDGTRIVVRLAPDEAFSEASRGA